MTMTAISKGFRRVMKLLYEYGNRHEKNVLNTTWSEKLENARNNPQSDEHLGVFISLNEHIFYYYKHATVFIL